MKLTIDLRRNTSFGTRIQMITRPSNGIITHMGTLTSSDLNSGELHMHSRRLWPVIAFVFSGVLVILPASAHGKAKSGDQRIAEVNQLLLKFDETKLTKQEKKAIKDARTRSAQKRVLVDVCESRHIPLAAKAVKSDKARSPKSASGENGYRLGCALREALGGGPCSDAVVERNAANEANDVRNHEIDRGGDPVDHSSSGDHVAGGGDVA